MEINTISENGMALIAVTGDGSEAAACLIRELLERTAEASYRVIEISRHDLAQGRTAGLTFELGVFTGLAQDDPDCRRAVEALLSKQCRKAVLDLDGEAGRRALDRIDCPVFTYSENKDWADLSAKNIRPFPGWVEFEALTLNGISRIHLPIPGGYSLYDALAALSVGLCLGLELEELARAVPAVRGMKGRVEVVPVPRAYTVIIDRAHRPNALEDILTAARDFTAGRLICVFGCCGGRDRAERPVMGAIAADLADLIVVTSSDPRTEDPQAIIGDILSGVEEGAEKVHVEPDRREAIAWALAQGQPGDVIVLAGKGRETWQEIGGVRYHMDEREVVAGWFKKTDARQKMSGKVLADVI